MWWGHLLRWLLHRDDAEDDGRAPRFQNDVRKYREVEDLRSILGVPLLVCFLVGCLAIANGVLEWHELAARVALVIGAACLVLCWRIWRAKEWARRVLPVVFTIVAVHQATAVVLALPDFQEISLAVAALSAVVVAYAVGPYSKQHFAQVRAILAGEQPLRPAQRAVLRRAAEGSSSAPASQSAKER